MGHAVNPPRTLGGVDSGPQAIIDLDDAIHRFLDEHITGIRPEQPAGPARIFGMGGNDGRGDPAGAPPDGAGAASFRAAGAGANSSSGAGRPVTAAPSAEEPPDTWVH